MARKLVALRAIRVMGVLIAWCVVIVGVMVVMLVIVTTLVTLVRVTPTKAREEHSQCDVISVPLQD